MSTEQIWQIKANNLEDTLAIAEQIGSKLRGGEVVELVSDLGGGKTAFVRGLAKGMGSTDSVHSPSFTLSNQYKAGDKTLFHFDFYRLQEPGIMLDEISEVITDPQAIVAVEWANIVENVLPAEHITVTIHAIDDNARELTISYPQSLEYAFEDVT